MEVILSAKGFTGQIDLYENRIEIKHKGFIREFDSTNAIFLKAITSVQFKEAGLMNPGYIQFGFPGCMQNKEGMFDAEKDKNTVMFSPEEKAEFEKIRDYIFSKG